MKRFTLYTIKHESELRDFAEKAAAAEMIYIQGVTERDGYAIELTVARRDVFCEALLGLLMDLAENDNAVYRYSAKLRVMAGALRAGPVFARELRRLREFVRDSKLLFMEGYVTFRMAEFREKLDMMIYSLVKKIKFGTGDW